MNSKKIINNDEIDLIETFDIIWLNKFKIIFSIFFFILLVYGFLKLNTPKNNYFEAETIIKPISSFVEDKYSELNDLVKSETSENNLNSSIYHTFEEENEQLNNKEDLSIFMVDKQLLMNLFIEKLQDGQIFDDSINKFKILNREDYVSDQKYQDAVNNFKSSILIEKIPLNTIGNVTNSWKIKFRTTDTDTWNKVLLNTELQLNEFVRKHLIEKFEVKINMLKKKRSFELEDIEMLITNSKADYKKEIQNRLFYLREQLEIARELNIAKSVSPTQTHNVTAGIIASITKDNEQILKNLETAYYLRGFEMIEKEIELITNRKNDDPYVDNLLNLEDQKRNLLQDKKIERIQSVFLNSPFYKTDFYAGKILTKSTNYERINKKKSKKSKLVVAGALGAILSICYVLIANAIKKRRKLKNDLI